MGEIMPPLFGVEDIQKQIDCNNKKIVKLMDENKELEKALKTQDESYNASQD